MVSAKFVFVTWVNLTFLQSTGFVGVNLFAAVIIDEVTLVLVLAWAASIILHPTIFSLRLRALLVASQSPAFLWQVVKGLLLLLFLCLGRTDGAWRVAVSHLGECTLSLGHMLFVSTVRCSVLMSVKIASTIWVSIEVICGWLSLVRLLICLVSWLGWSWTSSTDSLIDQVAIKVSTQRWLCEGTAWASCLVIGVLVELVVAHDVAASAWHINVCFIFSQFFVRLKTF